MARLTEIEKRQLLESTREPRPDAGGAAGTMMTSTSAEPLAMAVYFRQLGAIKHLQTKPKPVAFEGAYWRL